LIITN